MACKTIRFFNNAIRRKAVEDECLILARLQHPNIVRFYEVEWQGLQARLYMEYCEGGNLDKFVRNNEYAAAFYCHKVANKPKCTRMAQQEGCLEDHISASSSCRILP